MDRVRVFVSLFYPEYDNNNSNNNNNNNNNNNREFTERFQTQNAFGNLKTCRTNRKLPRPTKVASEVCASL